MAGARGRTRTDTELPPSGPKPGASTNFATRADELCGQTSWVTKPSQDNPAFYLDARALNCGDNQPVSIDHYENFPVASWLCPKELRPAVLSLYRFARVGDDLADEGIVSATQRRTDLEIGRAHV